MNSKNEDFPRCIVRDAKFMKAANLFELKWKSEGDTQIAVFIDYFHEHWIMRNKSWYEDAAPTFPSTNNAIEGTIETTYIKGTSPS